MSLYIAFFRGINVGGRNIISMKRLSEIIEKNGYTCIGTYIQSGNVIFQSSPSRAMKFPEIMSRAINEHCGFNSYAKVLNTLELRRAIDANPFSEAMKYPKALHLYFLDHVPKKPDFESLTKIKSANEQYYLIDKVFYLFALDGIGRSKLAARIEALLGVKATARNWNTVIKLLEMVSET